MDVFFYEAFEEETLALKGYLPPGITAGFTWKTIQEQGVGKPTASFISIRTQSTIPISWATQVSAILTRSSGYDHIKAYLENCGRDIPCGYLPLYCSRAVAEQAILLCMALLRKLPRQIHNFNSFNRDGLTGQECQNKTLLVVGVGNIGYEVIRIAKALNMDVLGVDIVKKYSDIQYVPIQEGLSHADIIICAMNLTFDNLHYFDYNLLSKTKPGIMFVNVARGELSPTSDLLRLLNENRLAGVALDVYNNESELAVSLRANKPSKNDEVQATLALAKHKNVILTPHNAFNTQEAVDKKASQSIQQIRNFLEHGNFIWQVPI